MIRMHPLSTYLTTLGLGSALLAGTVLLAATASAGPGLQDFKSGAPEGLAKPIAVFGTDDRVAVPPKYEALAARVGLLFNNQSRTVCTAFCVAENIVATAAHCLSRGQTVGVKFSEFNFARSYDRLKEYTHIEGHQTGSAAQNILSGDFRLRVRPPIDAAHDWALVKLQRNACPAGGIPIKPLNATELINASKTGQVFQISYHRDWAQWRPAYSKPCPVARDYKTAKWPSIAPDFIDSEHMILHSCDTGGASSGSPLLMDTPAGPVVVGINVGTYVQSKMVTQDGQVSLRQKSETIANTAVSAVAFAPFVDTLRKAAILPSGPPMKELQERLTATGFYAGRTDGAYGPIVKAAIEAYEKANRMPQTGLATQTLLSRLAADDRGRSEVVPSSSRAAPTPAR